MILASMENDAHQRNWLATTAKRTFLKKTLLCTLKNSVMNMLELIMKALRFGQPPRLPNILQSLAVLAFCKSPTSSQSLGTLAMGVVKSAQAVDITMVV
jgi:hypothetical protein